ncbi:MAG: hypothetical protein MRZ71_05885 [Bacteroidales bacterium]|nr:hypothetical protein [Bacteroidales bacterium]
MLSFDKVKKVRTKISVGIICGIFAIALPSCQKITTPGDVKYLNDFHKANFLQETNILSEDSLALYVDYSTCIAEGMKTSRFYEKLVPSFVEATKTYHAIKGDVIIKEEPTDTYNRLLNIEEVNYADLKTAAEEIVAGNTEAALLTDGEYYNPTKGGANPNNPYLTKAFKTWLKKGHDIYIISEPYKEMHKGIEYNKKRFYFLFTDSRLKNNIYERIIKTASINSYEGIEEFHLSANHPNIKTDETTIQVNESLAATREIHEGYEIQDWSISWKFINNNILCAVNPNTGEQLKNGDFIVKGMKIDRNTFGGYKIEDVDIKVYNINNAYMNFYTQMDTCGNGKIELSDITEEKHFMIIDHNQFANDGSADIYFDVQNFDNFFLKEGNPNNYIKIDFLINKTENAFCKNAQMFEFELLGQKGTINSSVVTSVEQCLVDKELEDRVKEAPFYTIYVKSNKY